VLGVGSNLDSLHREFYHLRHCCREEQLFVCSYGLLIRSIYAGYRKTNEYYIFVLLYKSSSEALRKLGEAYGKAAMKNI
jgi:hypothetical protein